jgi:uncharacterized protein (DUF4415 family)
MDLSRCCGTPPRCARAIFYHFLILSNVISSPCCSKEPEMADQPRRPRTLNDARSEAEAAFKKVTAKVAPAAPKPNLVPGVKEQVTLRIDQEVLEFFREGGPGWQDRINEVLRKAAGK